MGGGCFVGFVTDLTLFDLLFMPINKNYNILYEFKLSCLAKEITIMQNTTNAKLRLGKSLTFFYFFGPKLKK